VVLAKETPFEKPDISCVSTSQVREKPVHLPAIGTVFLPEDAYQMGLLPFDAIGHVEIIKNGEDHEKPDVAHKEQAPEEEKKSAQVHGVPDKGIGTLYGQRLVFVQCPETPGLKEGSEKGDEKSPQEQAGLDVRHQQDEGRQKEGDPDLQ
jgi:hypothetical protein